MKIELERLRRCPIQLRPVLKNTLDYLKLRDSVSDIGLLTPLLIRTVGDYYEVIDGAHRLEVCIDLQVQWVPCHLVEMTDDEVRQAQVVAHESRIDTHPAEYYRRLWQIVNIDKDMTINELATYLRWHPDKVKRTLSLVNLSPKGKKDLTRGDLYVTIAIEVCKLPVSRQDELLELNGTMPSGEYMELIRSEVRSYRDGKRGGKPTTHELRFRPLKEVKHEYLRPAMAASVLTALNVTTLVEAWRAGIGWVLKDDPASKADDENKERLRAAKEASLLHRRIANNLFGETHV